MMGERIAADRPPPGGSVRVRVLLLCCMGAAVSSNACLPLLHFLSKLSPILSRRLSHSPHISHTLSLFPAHTPSDRSVHNPTHSLNHSHRPPHIPHTLSITLAAFLAAPHIPHTLPITLTVLPTSHTLSQSLPPSFSPSPHPTLSLSITLTVLPTSHTHTLSKVDGDPFRPQLVRRGRNEFGRSRGGPPSSATPQTPTDSEKEGGQRIDTDLWPTFHPNKMVHQLLDGLRNNKNNNNNNNNKMCPSVFSALPLLLLLSVHVAGGDAEQFSFYDLLGVPTDADVRSIRRAFKRLALEKHPDKNPDDPEAHDVFVRINRAYEVLKDEELRKRYDQFGEKGLENNNAGAQRQQWESWEFYNDKFGIYDDDQEIVTLSRADFEEEVFESGEIWFVNFYSTYCSHCHHLAPTWREFAKSMDGIARIGAVNCAEDPELCRSQQVNAYPSLVLFPQRLWFRGARDLASLSAFLLANLPSQPVRSPAQFPQNERPLLVELDDGESEGMGEDERIKCAAMLQWLGGTLAVLECADGGNDVKMCEELGHRDGFLFYPRGAEGGEATEVFFADLVDLRAQLHHLLPALPRLSADELRWLISRPPDQDNEPMLVLFVNPARGTDHPEWRTLAQRFPQMNVHVVECADSDDEMLAVCAELHLGHLPRPVLFRPSGGYDIHYGNAQMDTRQVAKFIVRSGKSHLIVLNADKYEKHLAKVSATTADAAGGDTLWLVDHFVPWCQPCLRLLAELRKLPPEAEGHALRLGAVNCEAEPDICRRAGITSYPHSVLFTPDGVRHPLVGSHSVEQLLEFVAEALRPSVAVLNRTSFVQNVVHRPNGHLYFVDFHAPWCGPCQQLAPEFRRLARQFPLLSPQANIVSFGSVDCDALPDICDGEYVHSFPTIRLYRHRHDLQPYDYPPNWWRNAQSMTHWLAEMMPTLVQRLAGDFHSTVLGSVQPFLVDFYAPWCGHCVHFAPTFEKLAKLLEGQVQLGKVDCDRFGHICQMAGVQAFPSVVLYSGVDRVGDRQNARGIFLRHGDDASRMADEVREMLRQRGKGTHWQQERDEL